MPVLVLFVIWYFLYAQNKPDTYKKLDGKVGKIIALLVVFSATSSIIPAFLDLSIILLVIFSPLIAMALVIKGFLGIGRKKRDKRNMSSSKYDGMTTLTKSVPKRKKIIRKFNKKFDLNLNDEEMDRIVDASYLYISWEKEIYDMQDEYDTISQWYTGATGWLRAYLSVFPVHTISSDFSRQRQICLETFTQIFDEINPGSYGNVDDCIEDINDRYFASFNETTFMVVYRFLESCGKKYELPSFGIIKNETELDILRRKYDQSVDAMGSGDKNKKATT